MDTIPPRNTSFSLTLPTLQLTIDSTSLGEYKTCPRKYYYRIVEGWVPRTPSVHLHFGLLLHRGRERYERAKTLGATHDEALREALRQTLIATWDDEASRPWWSGHPSKNRLSLIRTLVWYLEQFGRDDPFTTIILSNGLPAVELSFKFSPGFNSPVTDEEITLSGHIDRLVEFQGSNYVSDIKTTSSALGQSYFAQYSPDNQISLYTIAGSVLNYGAPISGVIIDAIQVGATFSRFERQPITRTDAQSQEWIEDTQQWIIQMHASAELGNWPMNDRACHHYGGCPYRPVCSRPPGARQKWLEVDYTREIWDPAIARGDI